MSINLEESIENLIETLAQSLETTELSANPFTLSQDSEPDQTEWETAWLAAGNSLPIPEDQELYWVSGNEIKGQFARINDRFYCIFPSTSVVLGGVTYFAYTKFLGWEDGQHFFFSGSKIGDAGVVSGLFRAYMDGTCESVTFTGFTANTLLGYDEAQRKLWYIEGTDLKRIDIDTEVITVVVGGITVAPTAIVFDGAGDAFCTINVGAGLDVYFWDDSAATFTSIKASITVNGVGEDPGQVIAASLNYVVVLSSVSNYWVQFARVGGAETQIKSNPAGATAANLPAPSATAWAQILLGVYEDSLNIGYAELTGAPSISDWRRTLVWDMATTSYSNLETLPYDDFIAMCIAESPDADPVNYTARRVTAYHSLTSAYRKRVSNAWEYHNVSGVRPNDDASRMLIETDDGQIFVWANESSGKIWRISAWDFAQADSVVLGVVDITGAEVPLSSPFIDISSRPPGYDLIEISIQSGTLNGAEAVLNAGWRNNINSDLMQNTLNGSSASLIGGDGIYVDNNSYIYSSRDYPKVHGVSALNPQSLAQLFIFAPSGDAGIGGSILLTVDGTATGVVNNTTTYQLNITYLDSAYNPITQVAFRVYAGTVLAGKYMMARALRTDGRRKGGAYYDPSMA